jgi:hypothetical protein
MMNIGRDSGLVTTVRMVLLSISSATAPAEAKIETNKLVKNSVDKAISRRNLLSSSSEYIVSGGINANSKSAATTMMQ